MKFITKIFTTSFVLLFALSVLSPISASNQGIIPAISVVPCTGEFRIITQTGNNSSVVYKRLPKFATPGSTLTVTQSYATTITNSATITIIPEFLEMGYETSFTAGTEIGWSKTNNTSSILQLVILGIYDTFSVKQFYVVSEGSCALGSTKTYKVYEGNAFDIVP